MADQKKMVGQKQSVLSEVTQSNSCRYNSMKLEKKAVLCKTRSEVRITGGTMSKEEAKIKVELAEEIEKTFLVEIKQQISTLRRRLEELRQQRKSDVPVKKPCLTKSVIFAPKHMINGGNERKKKFQWENSLRSSSCESGSLRRRPWNDQISNSSPWK